MIPRAPLLIGEDNPHSTNPDLALFPYPEGSAGWRLAKVIMGISRTRYVLHFDRVNLCQKRWSMTEARRAVDVMASSLPYPGKVPPTAPAPEVHPLQWKLGERSAIVLLGAKVAEAFGIEFCPFQVVELDRAITESRIEGGWRVDAGRIVPRSWVGGSIRREPIRAALLPHPSGRSRIWNLSDSVERARTVLRELGVLPSAAEVLSLVE